MQTKELEVNKLFELKISTLDNIFQSWELPKSSKVDAFCQTRNKARGRRRKDILSLHQINVKKSQHHLEQMGKGSKSRYSKYLNCNFDNRRLSRGNKIYVKRLLKQNQEYRNRKHQTCSSSVENNENWNINSKPNKMISHKKNKTENASINVNQVVAKNTTKTYQKYLNVITNTWDYKSYLKKSQSRPQKSGKRASMERPIKNNLMITPKAQAQIPEELKFFYNKKYANNTKPTYDSSKGSKFESRYSKQLEEKMAERIIDSSFNR